MNSAIPPMGIAVLGYSFIPLCLALLDAHQSPFVFTAAIYAGQSVSIAIFLAIRFGRLLGAPRNRRTLISLLRNRLILVGASGYLNYAFFAWSLKYLDPSVSTCIFGGWSLGSVVLLGWLFRSDRRYGRVTPALPNLLAIGIVLVAASNIVVGLLRPSSSGGIKPGP